MKDRIAESDGLCQLWAGADVKAKKSGTLTSEAESKEIGTLSRLQYMVNGKIWNGRSLRNSMSSKQQSSRNAAEIVIGKSLYDFETEINDSQSRN